VGDFITIVSDKRSAFLGQELLRRCRLPSIDIPALLIEIPYGMEKIARLFPDILRSDHSCFWREEYPAIMVTDTANFRTPYYHTPGDTLDKLDFDFMKNVCQAVIATAVELP
jgi:hypothetical protein